MELELSRKWLVRAAVALAAVAVGVAVVLWLPSAERPEPHEKRAPALAYEPGGPVPAAAARAADTLTTDDERAQRSALLPESDAVFPPGRLFPVGTVLRLDDGGWHERNGYANATGELRVPGKPARKVFVGFAERDGSWRVVFMQVTS